jgi:hypothetical protein
LPRPAAQEEVLVDVGGGGGGGGGGDEHGAAVKVLSAGHLDRRAPSDPYRSLRRARRGTGYST